MTRVETVGYFHPPLPGLESVDRIPATQQKHPAADASALEREISCQPNKMFPKSLTVAFAHRQ
ncbi:MAG: hypothetical protein IH623_02750 [Verrucomicrobia bacterium]|nr:hypothetical protein [Verrucomicrobiota bacterium]